MPSSRCWTEAEQGYRLGTLFKDFEAAAPSTSNWSQQSRSSTSTTSPLKPGGSAPDNGQAMSPLQLMQILARAAASLSDPGAAPGAVERLLEQIPAEAGLKCDLSLSDGALEVMWLEPPGPEQEAFVAVLAECVTLAGAASARAAYSLLDARSFAAELDRVTAAARWRGHDASLAVFDVEGVAHGPGVDESEMVAHVGALARSAVRSNDIVGHLGAGRFALLLPRAGSFEARSAYRRVSTAVAASEYAASRRPVATPDSRSSTKAPASDLLGSRRQRLTDAQRRTAYEGPWDPSHSLAGWGHVERARHRYSQTAFFLQLDITSIIMRGRGRPQEGAVAR